MQIYTHKFLFTIYKTTCAHFHMAPDKTWMGLRSKLIPECKTGVPLVNWPLSVTKNSSNDTPCIVFAAQVLLLSVKL